ncbi:hypothetical protein LWI28_011322 [Acer negundo]|uniref:Uncharacterized protein n=1 Tax=Acer negundo TaxID=4023 RepID=A0AAD5NJD6_ACENE|nr:hypothetical protein LWI28_011322 [Acer negundo]
MGNRDWNSHHNSEGHMRLSHIVEAVKRFNQRPNGIGDNPKGKDKSGEHDRGNSNSNRDLDGHVRSNSGDKLISEREISESGKDGVVIRKERSTDEVDEDLLDSNDNGLNPKPVYVFGSNKFH